MTRTINLFQYCPKCGRRLERAINQRIVDCKNCGFHYYLNAAPTAAAILLNISDEILLVERKYPPRKGFWDLPGGFVDDDESMEESVKRELKEELGIKIGQLTYFKSIFDKYLFKGVTYNTVIAVYYGRIDQKIYPADDVASFRFFKRTEFPAKEFSFTKLANLVEDFIKTKK